uniref:AIG1-type G domain-containing protein n=1 Tax=Poecilia mexicana TaxID=48701 RepID=A0A3B3XP54_9TELE
SLSGKSSAGNFILGQNVFDTSRRTAQSEARQKDVFSRRVTVVDTPGWWWIWPKEETPKLDQIEIQNSVHLCPPGPHVFLLVIPVDLYLPQWVKASLKQHLKLFNVDVFCHTIMLITAVAPCSDEEVESRINTKGKELQELLEKCGNRYHVINPNQYGDAVQVKELFQKIINMVKQNKGCFTAESKQNTFLSFLWPPKQPTLTEKEWSRREQELVERMMKALAKEPEEPTEPHFTVFVTCFSLITFQCLFQ